MKAYLLITSLCGFIAGGCMTLLVLRFVFGIYLIDPYWLVCALLIALTIGTTAFVGSQDYLKEVLKGGN